MNSLKRIFFILSVAAISSCSAPEIRQTPKAVFIILDGIPADVIEKLNPPTLEEITNAGGYTRSYVGGKKNSYTETPTISAPGYMSLITGTWGNKHNVWDNDVATPNYHYWNIFRIAEHTKSEIRTAVFSSWRDNRTKLIGEGLGEAGSVVLDYKFDGLEHDTIKYPHDDAADYILKIDESVSHDASRYISAEGPDLSWIYLQYTDDMGHRFGDSTTFYESITMADLQIKKIWEAVKVREKQKGEDWLIIITTDHGRDASTGKDHGGQSERERTTWITTNKNGVNNRFRQSPGVVDILPSILNHLNVSVPDEIKRELDGVPFIGDLDMSDLTATKNRDSVSLRWKNFSRNRSDRAEIFYAVTNRFKDGTPDKYQKAGEAFLHQESFNFTYKNAASFLKILVKGPHHYVNVWIDETVD